MIGWSCDDEGEIELDPVDCEVVCWDHAFWLLDRPICHSEFDVRRKHFWAPPLTPTFIADYAYPRSGVDDCVTRRAVDANGEDETSVVALEMSFTYIYWRSFGLFGDCGRMRDVGVYLLPITYWQTSIEAAKDVVPWLDVEFEQLFECELYFFGKYRS